MGAIPYYQVSRMGRCGYGRYSGTLYTIDDRHKLTLTVTLHYVLRVHFHHHHAKWSRQAVQQGGAIPELGRTSHLNKHILQRTDQYSSFSSVKYSMS